MTDERDNIRDDFSPLLDGELDPERRAAIEKRLAEDADLLRELEAMKRVDELYRGMPRESAPDDLERRVRGELEPPRIQFRRRRVTRLALWPSLAAAAMFLVFGALTWQLHKHGTPESHRQLAMTPDAERSAPSQKSVADEAVPAPAPALRSGKAATDRRGGEDVDESPVRRYGPAEPGVAAPEVGQAGADDAGAANEPFRYDGPTVASKGVEAEAAEMVDAVSAPRDEGTPVGGLGSKPAEVPLAQTLADTDVAAPPLPPAPKAPPAETFGAGRSDRVAGDDLKAKMDGVEKPVEREAAGIKNMAILSEAPIPKDKGETGDATEEAKSEGALEVLAKASTEPAPSAMAQSLLGQAHAGGLPGDSGLNDEKGGQALGAQLQVPDERVPPLVPHEEPTAFYARPPQLKAPEKVGFRWRIAKSAGVAAETVAMPPATPAPKAEAAPPPKMAPMVAGAKIKSPAAPVGASPAPKRETITSLVTKKLGERTFEPREDGWQQKGYAAQETTVLKRDSEALRALVAQHTDLIAVVKLPGWVVFRVGNDWYKIPPVEAAKTD